MAGPNKPFAKPETASAVTPPEVVITAPPADVTAAAAALGVTEPWADDDQKLHLRHWEASEGLSSDLRAAFRAICRQYAILDAKLSRRQWMLLYGAMITRPTR